MDQLEKRIDELSPAKRALLELRLRQSRARLPRLSTIPLREDRAFAPLSFAQQRLWFLDQLEPQNALYNVPRAIELKGKLDLSALQQALDELARRHEVLRTHFSDIDGEVRQVVSKETRLTLNVSDLTTLPEEIRQQRASDLSQQAASTPFDLGRGPLMRAQLLRLSEQENILVLTNHHIVSDAWSGGILFNELSTCYNAVVAGESPSLEPLPIQYGDFAGWQREWLQGEELQRQLEYWRTQLSGASGVLDLPTDFPRSTEQQVAGDYKFITISRELTSRLNALSQNEGATMFMTLLAAFQILLWRYSGQSDVVIGSPIAGRNRGEIENLLGFFINSLALRADVSPALTFKQLLKQVRETALGAYGHQDLPFEKLVEELHPERHLSRNPIFQVMFQFQNAASPVLEFTDLKATVLDVATNTAKFDLMLAAREENGELLCVIEYSTGLFAGETIDRMLEQYAQLLQAAVSQPDEVISRLSLMTRAQRQEIVHQWNQTATEYPHDVTIDQLFAQQVQRTPDAVALIDGEQEINFDELNLRANRVAHELRNRGVGVEQRVAICVERSAEMIVALFGILKVGAVYVPVEPTFPAERMSFIVEDSQAGLVLTHSSLRHLFSDTPVLCLDELSDGGSVEDIDGRAIAQNAAHVIYTSGSTGRPKGVISSHSASINRFNWMWEKYPFAADEKCCQKTALSFVDSIWEIFGPLLKGVPLVIIRDDDVKDPARFVSTLAINRVTRLVLVPSLLRAMLDDVDNLSDQLRDLRICVCSGEALPPDLASKFAAALPQTILINLYGSSEVAADVTCYEVASALTNNVPIGRPIANTQIYLLDEEFQPVPVGIPGEIFVGGDGLARGYLNQPGLTAERFLPNPFISNERLFRTGDVGRYLPDGNIEYRGRRDHQVKLRGFRIELGEIESVLRSHPQITGAALVLQKAGDTKQLIAYFTADGTLAISELRTFLRSKLPDYMIPAATVQLPQMPLTASGKINRIALLSLGPVTSTEEFVAPRTPIEELLADIWAVALGLEKVGVTDDFFGLGGHSLLLAGIATRIRETFSIELPLRVLFEAPTIAELAHRIAVAQCEYDEKPEPPLVRRKLDAPAPLSFAQERLWFFDQIEPGSAAYNIPRAFRLRGPLDVDALRRSLLAMHERHEVLRSSFQNVEGKPALSIIEPTVDVAVVDLSSSLNTEESLNAFISEESQKPFDLARGPLIRVTLAKMATDDHVLVMTMHHIVSDGWSIGIALRELAAHYNAIISQQECSLPELPLQYGDFAAWQRTCLSGDRLENHLQFWREELRDAPRLINLQTDRPRKAPRSMHGARAWISVPADLVAKLKATAREQHATVFMALLAAYQALLASITHDQDIVIGSPAAGRDRPELENLIGYFVNTIALRGRIEDDSSFRELIKQARVTAVKAFAHQDVPFEKLVDTLAIPRSLEFNPLIQVWFVLQNTPSEEHDWHDLGFESLIIDKAVTRHDLQLTLWEANGGISGAFTGNAALFDGDSVKCIGEQFMTLLSMVASDAELKIREIKKRLAEVAREFRHKQEETLVDVSRQRLRQSKRRTVTVPS
jgi:amino acid adenylation domain-containing protein